KVHRPHEAVEALGRARQIWEDAPSEQRQRGRGVQVQVLFHLSRGLRDLGDFEGAAEALDQCCALDRGSNPPTIREERMLACRGEGGFPDALRLAADLAEQLGRLGDAARHLEALGRLMPDDTTLAARRAALAARGVRDETTSTTDPPLPPELAILDQVASDPTAEERRVGIVDRFFAEKGFGFLHYDEGRSIFFHVTQCEEGGEGIA